MWFNLKFPFILATVPPEVIEPCNPSPCGINARCESRARAASCSCIQDYIGNPYIECKPECVVNSECPRNLACVNQKCRDPCPGVCGVYASCYVTNHLPLCKCDPGYTGDAFVACQRITTRKNIYKNISLTLKQAQTLYINIQFNYYIFIIIIFYQHHQELLNDLTLALRLLVEKMLSVMKGIEQLPVDVLKATSEIHM